MTLLRMSLVLALALASGLGCAEEGPRRASDIQNVNGISDDISAVGMTQSLGRRPQDPNAETTLPNNYQTVDQP
jgi:hypothetical protein